MNLELVNPLHREEWDRLVLQHPDSTFFHSAAWASVLSKTYHHEPLYLCAFRQGRPLALLPMMEISSPLTGRRGVGLPFTDLCRPLVFQEDAWEIVLRDLSELARARGWKHFELRGGMEPPETLSPARGYLEHTLDLRGNLEEIFARFSSGIRRAIRKAEKSDLRLEVAQTREALQSYYRLHVQTRKRHGVPPQPYSFFLNIYQEVIEQGLGFIIIAHRGTVPIAGAVYFHFGVNAVYKFGASDEDYQEFRGNNLVMWEGIQLLNRGNFQELHFGRTSLSNDGLRNFKLGWGSQEKSLIYLKYHTATGKWGHVRDRSRGFHNRIFRNLPSLLNRLAGALIYPHLD